MDSENPDSCNLLPKLSEKISAILFEKMPIFNLNILCYIEVKLRIFHNHLIVWILNVGFMPQKLLVAANAGGQAMIETEQKFCCRAYQIDAGKCLCQLLPTKILSLMMYYKH